MDKRHLSAIAGCSTGKRKFGGVLVCVHCNLVSGVFLARPYECVEYSMWNHVDHLVVQSPSTMNLLESVNKRITLCFEQKVNSEVFSQPVEELKLQFQSTPSSESIDIY